MKTTQPAAAVLSLGAQYPETSCSRFRFKGGAVPVALIAFHFWGSAEAQEARSAAAHQHGTSVVEIAVEDGEILMRLFAPGADIVGFEHPPTSEADTAALEAAKEILSNPFDLFGLPMAANCEVEHASVEVATEGSEHDDHAHDDHAEAKHAADDGEHEEDHEEDHGEHDHAEDATVEAHLEFVAEYHVACGDMAAIDRISLGFFDRFPNAGRLSFTILTETGAIAAEADRGQASFDIDLGS